VPNSRPARVLWYHINMTKLLKHAVDVARGLPPDAQDDLARVLLELAGEDQSVVELTPEESAALDESLAQADRGEFATDDQVRALWAKYGL
jgi:hypothetical protein